ncbi:pentapeptide repeat-containing protein [Escherichia sp. E4742]|uniref:pentapeptide repeat-containing protein n=1 Tax=Escherichia sp. E4742 TaxID=2044467 RepID=UPI00108125C9|nr:pentapeptide repeat-containing protein [Escherichia sp. E4742]QCT90014.1 pentapeptide repeat-containing protein [Escherichia sp. E4742]TGB59493.1 hypothetical protein CRI69_06695 [Escherichia sp. E4742]TLJ09244.1 pentapeptide repeat-containing protein [Escherichia sp. E4742]
MIRIDFVTDDVLYLDTDSLIGWDFSGMNLHRAVFDGMCMDGARFNDAHLRNISFIKTSLIGGNLSRSALMCAWLNHADLTNCNFAQSRPIAADFSHARLCGADFTAADLRGANFAGTDLQNVCFNGAHYDKRTVWPAEFDPKIYGAVLVE